MLLRPLRRAPMMLGGVGFQAGLDKARRSSSRPSGRRSSAPPRRRPGRRCRAAQGLEGAPRRRRALAGGVPGGEAQGAGRLSEPATAMPLGPVQLLVVGFDRPDFSGEVLAELERLRASDVVRVIDLLVVHKGADGVVRRLHHSDLTVGEAEGAGAVVGALIGLGATRVEAEHDHLGGRGRVLVSRRGHPERLRRRGRAGRAPLGDRHARRDARRGRRCGRRRVDPSG